ncbi:MAG: histidine phosphatase family protein [Polyangiales bacterium]|nr:histidine phosphatase family protein [Myxococcales bacterium]
MRITFVRHAESQANLEGKWQGQSNSPLSKLGRTQARKAALRLAKEHFDVVIASDLDRTMETARAFERPLEPDAAWREIDVGTWEGLTSYQVSTRFVGESAALAEGQQDVKVGGGESWNELTERAVAAFDKLIARLGDKDHALVVSHGGLLATLVAELLGIRGVHPRPLGRLGNTAIVSVRIDGGHIEIERYNDAGHLAPATPAVLERVDSGNTVVALLARGDAETGTRFRTFHKDIRAVYGDSHVAHAKERAPESLLETHGPGLCALEVEGDTFHGHAHRIACGALRGRARLGLPRAGGYAHVAVSESRSSLVDYNLTGHLDGTT